MVSQIGELYQCDDCLLKYQSEQEAQACEEWCIEHGTCNIELTKNHVRE